MRDRFKASPLFRPQIEAGAIAVSSTPVTANRSTLAITLEVAPAVTAETLQTVTASVAGAATSTFSSRVISSGKKLRLSLLALDVECLGSGTAPQRAYLRVRSEPSGATTAASPLQLVLAAAANGGLVNVAGQNQLEISDGLELTGDGNRTFGFTLETPDYVASTGTLRVKATVLAFEY